MKPLGLYSIFHLNLMFSSIEAEQRAEVIARCYWPLLKLIRQRQLPIGIEATGYTLETIAAIDPTWIAELRSLCHSGPAEFIGSGYAQIIGPLVPARVNQANQRLGLRTYEKLLGLQPQLVFVNEQAYSGGLVPIYLEAGYQALIMEWDNPASNHPEWPAKWRYLPQYVEGPDSSVMPVIWNKSIPFQKFQRYVHGEIELEEYLEFLAAHHSTEERTFALYGNDAEIFDFRPGRFHTEAALAEQCEWQRIDGLYAALLADQRYFLLKPKAILDFLRLPGAGNRLRLESAAQPIPVKKQAKYNVLRWSVSGRDDLAINSACWRIFEAMVARGNAGEEDWQELCFLWSSDFRTHITSRRWQAMRVQLDAMQRRIAPLPLPDDLPTPTPQPADIRFWHEGHLLVVETPAQKLRLNLRRGLAIHDWWDKKLGSISLFGTLPHGYFDDIRFGMDYYTGHFVLEVAGQHKTTDLVPVSPKITFGRDEICIRAEIQTHLGIVRKTIRVHRTMALLSIKYTFNWPNCPLGTLRLGHVTLNPEAFCKKSLFFRTHNGGPTPETFHVNGQDINHLAPVSTLVSATGALGMTSRMVEVGDREHWIRIETDQASAALSGHILHAQVNEGYLYRVVLSAMEMDDTACKVKERDCFDNCSIRLTLSSHTPSTRD